jgi:hypothetical protein
MTKSLRQIMAEVAERASWEYNPSDDLPEVEEEDEGNWDKQEYDEWIGDLKYDSN